MIGARLKEGDCVLIDAKSVSRGEYFDALRRDELRPASHPACIAVMGHGPRRLVDGNDACSELALPTGGRPPWEGEPLFPWPPSTDERELPMACINWCDALAYCESKGKRLCRGGREDDGSVSLDSLNDASRDEWFSACSGGGSRRYPYGDSRLTTEQCRSYREVCDQGGYAGLFGMTDLRAELAENCAHDSNVCIVRGNIVWPREFGTCQATKEEANLHRLSHDLQITFRCCSDP